MNCICSVECHFDCDDKNCLCAFHKNVVPEVNCENHGIKESPDGLCPDCKFLLENVTRYTVPSAYTPNAEMVKSSDYDTLLKAYLSIAQDVS